MPLLGGFAMKDSSIKVSLCLLFSVSALAQTAGFGVISGVVYANGDVSVCEQHFPLGNLREKSFFEIWDSPEAQKLRAQIKAKACYCTNEIFMWSSIVFQPVQLTRAMVGARKSFPRPNVIAATKSIPD